MPFKTPLGERDGNRVPPTFIRPLQDKRAIIGQQILLECQVEGHPDPMVKWMKEGHNVSQCPDYQVNHADCSAVGVANPPRVQISQEKNKYRLLIKNSQGSDCGRFTVQAMN